MTDHMKLLDDIAKNMWKLREAYDEAKKTIQEEQGVMQDIAHKLELYRTTVAERQRLATIYANSARKRRACKEVVEALFAYMKYERKHKLTDSICQITVNASGVKDRQNSRQYTPRSEKIRFDDVEKYDISYYKGDKNENTKQNNKID